METEHFFYSTVWQHDDWAKCLRFRLIAKIDESLETGYGREIMNEEHQNSLQILFETVFVC
jgi:hypothetical protein